MRLPENNYIEWVCPTQEEMDLEIELAFLESRLRKLKPGVVGELVRKYLDDVSAKYDWEYDEWTDNWQTIMDMVE